MMTGGSDQHAPKVKQLEEKKKTITTDDDEHSHRCFVRARKRMTSTSCVERRPRVMALSEWHPTPWTQTPVSAHPPSLSRDVASAASPTLGWTSQYYYSTTKDLFGLLHLKSLRSQKCIKRWPCFWSSRLLIWIWIMRKSSSQLFLYYKTVNRKNMRPQQRFSLVEWQENDNIGFYCMCIVHRNSQKHDGRLLRLLTTNNTITQQELRQRFPYCTTTSLTTYSDVDWTNDVLVGPVYQR